MFSGLVNWFKLGAMSLALVVGCNVPAMADTATSQGKAEYSQALRGKTLRIAVTLTPPFAFITDSMSELSGIDIDLIRELQKRTGFNIEQDRMVVMQFDAMLDAGRQGKADILGGGITLSDSRRPYFDFSAPYMESSLVMAVRKSDNIHSIQDLKGRRLAAEHGSTASDLIPSAKELNIATETTPSAFMSIFEVHSNDADAVILDKPMIDFYIHHWPESNLTVVEELSHGDKLGLLFKKSDDISGPLRAAYDDMVKDGTVERIVSKYTGYKLSKR